ncbi:MAG: preprotein translocase subunit YajC [Alphaproteobacteria bacterium]|nr:preprotein translocase subunit YajC [Alphaproteobacteria bacterium]
MLEAEQATIDTMTNAPQQGSVWGLVLYLVVVLGIIYLLIVRPNKRRMAEYQKMLDSLKVGNRVLAAGIYGTIKKISETTIDVEIAKGVVVEVSKNAVANVEK